MLASQKLQTLMKWRSGITTKPGKKETKPSLDVRELPNDNATTYCYRDYKPELSLSHSSANFEEAAVVRYKHENY